VYTKSIRSPRSSGEANWPRLGGAMKVISFIERYRQTKGRKQFDIPAGFIQIANRHNVYRHRSRSQEPAFVPFHSPDHEIPIPDHPAACTILFREICINEINFVVFFFKFR
jgi:hypothetical protein